MPTIREYVRLVKAWYNSDASLYQFQKKHWRFVHGERIPRHMITSAIKAQLKRMRLQSRKKRTQLDRRMNRIYKTLTEAQKVQARKLHARLEQRYKDSPLGARLR